MLLPIAIEHNKAGRVLNRRRTKLKPYKVSRGSLEEQKLREDKRMETQRALLFILPVVMIAVLAVGIFFGYKSYEKAAEQERKDFEQSVATEPVEHDPMLLSVVSPAYPLDESYVPALVDCQGIKVSPELVDSLNAMLDAAKTAGHELMLNEGYISFKEQKERYDAAVKKYRKSAKVSLVKAESQVKLTTPREGECEQQTGLIVKLDDNVKGKFENGEAYKWLCRHCVDYGFILRYPYAENVGGLGFSSQLFRYVGVENAYNIRAYNMSFDEYANYMAFQ